MWRVKNKNKKRGQFFSIPFCKVYKNTWLVEILTKNKTTILKNFTVISVKTILFLNIFVSFHWRAPKITMTILIDFSKGLFSVPLLCEARQTLQKLVSIICKSSTLLEVEELATLSFALKPSLTGTSFLLVL